MKKAGFGLLIVFFASCGNTEEELTFTQSERRSDTLEKITTSTAHAATSPDKDTAFIKPRVKSIKNPSGIYQFLLPEDDGSKIEHTVQFYVNHTYRLQEKYLGNRKDSIAIAEGTWAPSDGMIWLYKDQVVRGRYKWKGDALQYFSPQYNMHYTMHSLNEVLDNKVWKNKKNEGIILFAIGNEPFWNLEFTNKDTIRFLLSEWTAPVKMKIKDKTSGKDSTAYYAEADSTQIKVLVLPYFCKDGMNDYVYPNKIQVQYNKQTYTGCGVLYQ